MHILFYNAKAYDKEFFTQANQHFQHDIRFVDAKLNIDTVDLINDEKAICLFVNECADREVMKRLSQVGVQLIALRCAGFNNVDIKAAHEFGITVVRVPAYSPYAVAEHTLGLMLSLNRKIHRAYNRVRDGNFALDGLLGFDFHGRTAGIIGTGRIGALVAKLLRGMGMKVVAYDPQHHPDSDALGIHYVSLADLFAQSDVISLHCPLTPDTHHMIGKQALQSMKQGAMLINTSRGALLDTQAVIHSLKSKHLGYLGLDVYEQESELFFEDFSCDIIQDDIFERLLTFPNVLITSHQGFFTKEALQNIADTTLNNIKQFEKLSIAQQPIELSNMVTVNA
ncbi:MAG TPA: 2-hydroxyacid dehydrogenase [Mariprofundaceae bacterium]|nr:2-hydroxyacid dehydrogenase [Mariprofundaceae bacterium]